jgi:hypothetical protein
LPRRVMAFALLALTFVAESSVAVALDFSVSDARAPGVDPSEACDSQIKVQSCIEPSTANSMTKKELQKGNLGGAVTYGGAVMNSDACPHCRGKMKLPLFHVL